MTEGPSTIFSHLTDEEWLQALIESIKQPTVNGVALEKHLYATPGEHVYSEKIPLLALQHDGLRIQFAVDEPFSFGEDDRELGVLVNFTGRCPVLLSFF